MKVRISTTVESNLLAEARGLFPGATDAVVMEAALRALMRGHREAEIDRDYAEGYVRIPLGTPDEWGNLEDFVDAAGRL